MTFSPDRTLQSFLPSDQIWPEEFSLFLRVLDDKWDQMVDALNQKDIGIYSTFSQVVGQRFPNPANPQRENFTQRVAIYPGTLPNAGTSSTAHGISITANTRVTRIYGAATRPFTAGPPTAFFIPLPYIDTTTPGDSVQLDMDVTNVNLTTTTANYIGFTNVVVIIEWLEEL